MWKIEGDEFCSLSKQGSLPRVPVLPWSLSPCCLGLLALTSANLPFASIDEVVASPYPTPTSASLLRFSLGL